MTDLSANRKFHLIEQHLLNNISMESGADFEWNQGPTLTIFRG